MVILPYSPDNGASTNGPAAKPRRYIETTRDPSLSFVEQNSVMIFGIPVAKMDDHKGLAVRI